jgi:hypothetical protein
VFRDGDGKMRTAFFSEHRKTAVVRARFYIPSEGTRGLRKHAPRRVKIFSDARPSPGRDRANDIRLGASRIEFPDGR